MNPQPGDLYVVRPGAFGTRWGWTCSPVGRESSPGLRVEVGTLLIYIGHASFRSDITVMTVIMMLPSGEMVWWDAHHIGQTLVPIGELIRGETDPTKG